MYLGTVIHQLGALQKCLSLQLPFPLYLGSFEDWGSYISMQSNLWFSSFVDCVFNTSLLTQSHNCLFLCFLPSFITPAFRFRTMVYFEFIFIQCALWVQVHCWMKDAKSSSWWCVCAMFNNTFRLFSVTLWKPSLLKVSFILFYYFLLLLNEKFCCYKNEVTLVQILFISCSGDLLFLCSPILNRCLYFHFLVLPFLFSFYFYFSFYFAFYWVTAQGRY